jgi:long-chain acyl-CoA synthetase
MKGYYKDPVATREVLRDGWLKTGDLGCFDEDGYLYVVGRLKEMIIRGGQNIYPTEVENVLSTYPGIEECAVVGVEDEQWGQEVLAALKVTEGQQIDPVTVIDFCRSQIAAYKCPRIVRFVTEFPKTATGKIKKSEIVEAFAAGSLTT